MATEIMTNMDIILSFNETISEWRNDSSMHDDVYATAYL